MYCYTTDRKDMQAIFDEMLSWAEASWMIGGIAYHKKQDLERRLKKHLDPKMLREDELQTAVRMCQEALQQLADEGHWSPSISSALDKCMAVLDPA